MSDFDDVVEDLEHTGLHEQIFASMQLLNEQEPDGTAVNTIGEHAWNQLSIAERAKELPHLLGYAVIRVMDERRAESLDREAAEKTTTYLGDFDVQCMWDDLSSVSKQLRDADEDTDVDVTVNARSLMNILSELELLQHRLAMRAAEGGDES